MTFYTEKENYNRKYFQCAVCPQRRKINSKRQVACTTSLLHDVIHCGVDSLVWFARNSQELHLCQATRSERSCMAIRVHTYTSVCVCRCRFENAGKRFNTQSTTTNEMKAFGFFSHKYTTQTFSNARWQQQLCYEKMHPSSWLAKIERHFKSYGIPRTWYFVKPIVYRRIYLSQ